MGGKDGCKGRLEAATTSDILYLFGQRNFIFVREKSGNFENSCLLQPCMRKIWLRNDETTFFLARHDWGSIWPKAHDFFRLNTSLAKLCQDYKVASWHSAFVTKWVLGFMSSDVIWVYTASRLWFATPELLSARAVTIGDFANFFHLTPLPVALC